MSFAAFYMYGSIRGDLYEQIRASTGQDGIVEAANTIKSGEHLRM